MSFKTSREILDPTRGTSPSAPPAPEVSVVMPCLNEAATLGACIEKARRALSEHNVAGEIIVADNGSTDGSQAIAAGLGARVVHVAERGYGSALMGGIAAARGRYVIMGDADDSYDFSEMRPFIERLRAGYDLVMGNRFRGGIKQGAMRPLHKYVGNPVLSGIGRLFFRSPVGDFHCGLRGFKKTSIERLNLRTTGMEFASEMVVKATLHKMLITEVPTTLSPDGRGRPPHLRSWRDGWRHLRFLLLYSPRWLFLIPGVLLALSGLIGYGLALPGVVIRGVRFDVHTLLFASLAILCGYQSITFAIFTKAFAVSEGLLPEDPQLKSFLETVSLERGLLAGVIGFAAGAVLLAGAIYQWWQVDFGDLEYIHTMRWVIPGALLTAVGFQTMLASFLVSILRMRRR